ncbi:probable inorganic phosphate transporter 1-12 [Phragmites australis]|uniref:probable inorganic phosphate transporter 1-12 n=1 Tax=Phragmites australis TaxID=29695 RepID=UPI002D768B96|nr:probable inorganic phosphate transporter 1-12 [Phragmites australis]
MTLLLVVICSIVSGLSFSHTHTSNIALLYFFYFWFGFGIGGDYPLSTIIISVYSNKKTRGGFIAAIFAMQGFDILAGDIITLVISTTFCKAFSAPVCLVNTVASTVP